jgi:hypothetical protein
MSPDLIRFCIRKIPGAASAASCQKRGYPRNAHAAITASIHGGQGGAVWICRFFELPLPLRHAAAVATVAALRRIRHPPNHPRPPSLELELELELNQLHFTAGDNEIPKCAAPSLVAAAPAAAPRSSLRAPRSTKPKTANRGPRAPASFAAAGRWTSDAPSGGGFRSGGAQSAAQPPAGGRSNSQQPQPQQPGPAWLLLTGPFGLLGVVHGS